MIGKTIKELRESNNYGQREVAQYLNKTVQAYSQYERDKRAPDIETITSLALFYNVSTDFLLGLTKIKRPFYKDCISKLIIDLEDLTPEDADKILDYATMIKTLHALKK